MEKNINLEGQEDKVELRKILQSYLGKEESPVELGDVSKWEKIDPINLLIIKKLGLSFNEAYLPLLRENKDGFYVFVVGRHYQKKAKEEGLTDVSDSIESLLQQPGTTMEQLMLYASTTFKKIPDMKKIMKTIEQARKEAKKFEKSLEEKVNDSVDEISSFGVYFEAFKIGAKKSGRVLGNLALKATYPVLGSLPYGVQVKLEEKLGRENYNATNASIASMIALPIAYGVVGYLASNPGAKVDNAMWGICIGGVVESLMLRSLAPKYRYVAGSIVLELAYLPVKGISYLYKKAKEGLRTSLEEARAELERKRRTK